MTIEHELAKRILPLNTLSNDPNGKCVLYVMSRDQRVQDNHALLAAQQHALRSKLPLAVVFCLYPKTGQRSREQFIWMLDGLRHVEQSLALLNIPLLMLVGDPYDRLSGAFHHLKPAAVYFDLNPLRGPRKLQRTLAASMNTATYLMDTHNIVPVWEASEKQEYAARTMRIRIHKQIKQYLVEPHRVTRHPYTWPGVVQSMHDLQPLIDELLSTIPRSNVRISFVSGETAAQQSLERFITSGLKTYASDRNNPTKHAQSHLSPYLHFGQLSALRIALRCREIMLANDQDLYLLQSSKMPDSDTLSEASGINQFLEELIVRKELSDNFCWFNPCYDTLDAAPKWARQTLEKHRPDTRQHIYSFDELDSALTHDAIWNAAQHELKSTGKMHGYMRMYWAKKVLEWTASPEEAIEYLIRLNDFYSLDGGDPNGYAGILWSVAGVHDRPWFERPVYGTIRYMNANGIRRKIPTIDQYVNKWGRT